MKSEIRNPKSEKRARWLKRALAVLALAPVCWPEISSACAACYGQSDSPLAKGMNWGIFSLLAVVATVLGTIASFFVYLGRRSATLDTNNRSEMPAASEETNRKV